MKRRTRIRLIAVPLAILLVGAGVYWLGIPWIIRQQAISALKNAGFTSVSLRVTRATPWQTDIADVSAGAVEPVRIAKISVSYSPATLLHRQLTDIHIWGLVLTSNI